MASRKLFIVCYDISSDRVRAGVARRLESLGARVQGSVFEVWMTNGRARRLVTDLGAMIDGSDSLRVYPLTRSGIGATLVTGRGAAPETADFYLL